MILGITGGIGSGKSTVAGLLGVMGIPVYIADDESRRITGSSVTIREQLIQLFGEDIYKNGNLDKLKLATLIFENEENLKRVNTIVHPEVLTDFRSWANRQNKPLVAIESAILFESGFDKYMDLILTVVAPLELKISRVRKRTGWSEEEIKQRIQNQCPDSQKILLSNFVIQNDGSAALIPQVENLIEACKSHLF